MGSSGDFCSLRIPSKTLASSHFPPVRFKAPSQHLMPSLSHKMIHRTGLVRGTGRGLFALMPLGVRAIEKITAIVDEEMKSIRASKVIMPCLASGKPWKMSGRWENFGGELFRLKDRVENDFCLSPTHEEVITKLVAGDLRTHRQFPIRLYQIGHKFRDEPKAQKGLLRAREFIMKDLYTFDRNQLAAENTYREVSEAYNRIFKRMELPYSKVQGCTGNIGGSLSHEYQLPALVGEDEILSCKKCSHSYSVEYFESLDEDERSKARVCESGGECDFDKKKSIEIGHTFLLGSTYSKTFEAKFEEPGGGGTEFAHMGCYGIGITRLLAAALEVSIANDKRLTWPHHIAPYAVHIVSLGQPEDEGYLFLTAHDLYESLEQSSYCDSTGQHHILCRDDLFLEDRMTTLTAKERLVEAATLGFPFLVIIGSRFIEEGLYELQLRPSHETEQHTKESLVKRINELIALKRGIPTS